jgi:hypothetical protein
VVAQGQLAVADADFWHLVRLRAGMGKQFLVLPVMELGDFLVDRQLEHRSAEPGIDVLDAQQVGEGAVAAEIAPVRALVVDGQRYRIHQLLAEMQLFGELCLGILARRDVGADRDVLGGQAAPVEQRDDGGCHPIQASVFLQVADFAVPDLAAGDGLPHVGEYFGAMDRRFHDAMVAADQFPAGVAADFAELVVGVGDRAGEVGDADDGVLIEGELEVVELVALGFALADQFRNQARQRLQFLDAATRGALGAGLEAQQLVHRRAQCAHRARLCLDIGAQPGVGFIEFRGAEFQAAGAQFEVAIRLLVGGIDAFQQAAEIFQQRGHGGIESRQGGRVSRRVEQRRQPAFVGQAQRALDLALQAAMHGKRVTDLASVRPPTFRPSR